MALPGALTSVEVIQNILDMVMCGLYLVYLTHSDAKLYFDLTSKNNHNSLISQLFLFINEINQLYPGLLLGKS